MSGKGFVKVRKSSSYFSRFQVKYRRRREGKTNYRKRRLMVVQDKTKFNTPKYRFVVRISNKSVTCQVIWSKINGDQVLCSAYSSELPRYGMPVALKSYSGVYCTAFLCGRRLLQQLDLGDKYEAVQEISGDQHLVDPDEEVGGSKPFKCFLDIGLSRASLGSRVFAALKGACDAGLFIPHKTRKYPGYDPKRQRYDPEKHRERIMGIHIQRYQEEVKEADEEKYNKMFSQYVKHEISPDKIPDMIEECIENIKKNPMREAKKEKPKPTTNVNKYTQFRKKKLPIAVRKQKVEYRRRRINNKLERMKESRKN